MGEFIVGFILGGLTAVFHVKLWEFTKTGYAKFQEWRAKRAA